ncbi:MAG: preprotein translocase subunit YajC [Bacteroidales bacterium]|nr:preprotein translocase subunit YajC [Bacteroidales bacterium]
MLLDNILAILCDSAAAGAGEAQATADYSGIIMIVLLIAIFYFFMIRPQSKRQKKIKEERAKLEKGSRVFTQGGIYGKVAEVKDTVFVVEIAPSVKITVDKNCVYPATEEAVQDAQQAANK